MILTPSIPEVFERDLPSSCKQVLLVVSKSAEAASAVLWPLERSESSSSWQVVSPATLVSLGRSGMAWGAGEHTSTSPTGFRVKREGDGCSPSGIFRLPFAFGYAKETEGLRMPYVPVTPTLCGVDDPESRFYNQVVDSAEVVRDWSSDETMLREDGLYRWGAFVAHNPDGTPGMGSCIFLHLWRGAGQPTAGCTAMSEECLVRTLRWLDAKREPRLVQILAEWCDA